MDRDLTQDRLLGGRVRLLQPRRGYRVAVDAVLLAAAVDASTGQRVLDLGSGVGAVGLCLAARVPGTTVTGVELQPELTFLARRNAGLNNVEARVKTIVHDLAFALPAALAPFDHVCTNPPYLAAAVADPPPDASKALATVESSAGLARWLAVAAGALRDDGTLTLIHRSDRAAGIAPNLAALRWGHLLIKRPPPAARRLARARTDAALRRRRSPPPPSAPPRSRSHP